MKLLYKTAHFTDQSIKKMSGVLEEYVAFLQDVARKNSYNQPESFINVPFDEKQINQVFTVNNLTVNQHLKYVLVLGIGGSSLGAKAIYDAIQGHYLLLQPEHFPKVFFMDTIDPDFRKHLEVLLKREAQTPEEVLITVVSESGTTLETRNNLEFLMQTFPHYKERVVILTNVDSPLWKEDCENPDKCLVVPRKVGGRYSVFTPVGMFPLSVVGVNILGLVEGAMEARKDGILPGVEENKALLSAVVSYMVYERGLTTQVSFVFNPKLESVGKWWCQLLAESLGKDGKGVTPLISVGTNDLHSMLQLYIDGPRDKFFNFISCESEMSREVRAVLSGVKKSFDEHKIPYTETILDRIDEHSLGYFMQTKMMEVIMLGKLMGINPFGQSAVEDYKKYARELLA